MRKLTADLVYLHNKGLCENILITVNDENTITGIESYKGSIEDADVEVYQGLLVPGLINAHCHLELSHMHNEIATGIGLIPFIKDVVTRRDHIKKDKMLEIANADAQMFKSGVQAVGDISNVIDSFSVKKNSPLKYHTFIEAFDFFNEDKTQNVFDDAIKVYEKLDLKAGDKKSIVPHAPYSTSPKLMRMIDDFNQKSNVSISIHNQETEAENEFLISGTGEFDKFYKDFGIDTSAFKATGERAVFAVRNNMRTEQNILLVHNSMTENSDVVKMEEWSNHIFWVTCPNANLYIENTLPDYKVFIDHKVKMCIGTDSLASNWQLSVWDELKTIAKYNSFIQFETLLEWATINGANALGMDDIGRFEIGLNPGINHIRIKPSLTNEDILNSEITRLI